MEHYIDGRRDYVERVRSSFAEEDVSDVAEAKEASFSCAKLSFLIALILFALFYYWNETGVEWYGYTAKDVVDMIEENQYYTNLQDYVMIGK